MATFEHGDATIHYEEHGSGYPVLLIAPGGMRSSIGVWANAPWNPVEQLSTEFRVIAMDQRNAGLSTAPVSGSDGWHTYTADQLRLLDHLGIDRCHVAGMCIGGSYILGLLEAAPERFTAAVLFQPIGFDDNRAAFLEMFDAWADELRPGHPEATEDDWASFRRTMYGGDFTFNSSREFVRGCQTPMLVLKGADVYHPTSTSLEIAELAPNATLIDDWKEGPARDAARAAVAEFLMKHTPAE